MVWSGIQFNARTELVLIRNVLLIVSRNRDEIIVHHVQPFAENFSNGFIFLHDNVKPHTANIFTALLRDANIQSLEWPAKSSDFNPTNLLLFTDFTEKQHIVILFVNSWTNDFAAKILLPMV